MLIDIARAIAKANGDDYDQLPHDKPHWIRERGEFGGRYRDINEPRQPDYDDMAVAAVEAMGPITQALVSALVPFASVANAIARDTECHYADHTSLANAIHMSAPHHPTVTIGDARRAVEALVLWDRSYGDE